MFGANHECKIGGCTPKVSKRKGEVTERYCELSLQFPFDAKTAKGLGQAGKDALAHLQSGDQEEAKFSINSSVITGLFKVGKSEHALKGAKGISAVATTPTKKGSGLVLTARLRFDTNKKDLCFFVDHQEDQAKVRLDKEQLDIPGT